MTIALIGFGVVGQGLYKLLTAYHGPHKPRLKTIVVKQPNAPRPAVDVPITTDAAAALADPEVELVVEAISESEPAKQYALQALANGKHYVSANKKMLATYLPELQQAAQQAQKALRYEAAVGGAMPVLHLLHSYFPADAPVRLRGILNGTCNYILSQLEAGQLTYAQALQEAQALGYAEADPTMDVEGYDAKFKIILAAALAWGQWQAPEQVLNLGINTLRPEDFAFARQLGGTLKLVARAECGPSGLTAAVLPEVVLPSDELYGISQELNALQISTQQSGSHLVSGKGAGSHPTGTALLADVLAVAAGRGSFAGQPLVQAHGTAQPALWVYLRADEGLAGQLLSQRRQLGTNTHVGQTTATQLLAAQPALVRGGAAVAYLGERLATQVSAWNWALQAG